MGGVFQYVLCLQKSHTRRSSQDSLSRKEKLMLELQNIDKVIEQKLSIRSQTRKNKLLSELKAIDRVIEQKSKKN